MFGRSCSEYRFHLPLPVSQPLQQATTARVNNSVFFLVAGGKIITWRRYCSFGFIEFTKFTYIDPAIKKIY